MKRKYVGNNISKVSSIINTQLGELEDTMNLVSKKELELMWNKDDSKKVPIQVVITENDNPVVNEDVTISKSTEEIGTGTTDDTGLVVWNSPEYLSNKIVPATTYSVAYADKSVDIEFPEDATYVNASVSNGSLGDLDTDGSVFDPNYNLGRESDLEHWNYTLDDDNNIITLNYHIDSVPDVIVYANYKVGGNTYKTQLNTDPLRNLSNAYLFKNTHGYGSINSDTGNIETITFSPNLDTSNLTHIHEMFSGCTSLREINGLEYFDVSSVESIDSLFSRTAITSIDLSSWNTNKLKNCASLFNGCSSLVNVNLNNINISGVENIDNMFTDCTSLVTLDLRSFDTRNVISARYTFARCTKLTKILATNGKWNLSKVPSGVLNTTFSGCGCSSVTYA